MTSEPDIVFERDGSLVTVVVDGQPQSAVDLTDPQRLDFEYVQHLAMCIDALTPPGVIRVTHVGGAGLTLARWVAHTRPGSPQVVLEPDAALTEFVRAELPLPRRHRIRVRAVSGETGIRDLNDGSADLIVVDAYSGGRVPAELTTVEWFAQVRRVMAPGGLALANLADQPGLRYTARVAASARAVLGHVALVGLHEVLKNRRFGNVVLVASAGPLDLYRLRRAAASAVLPTGVLSSPDLDRRHPGIRPFTAADDDRAQSPDPPARDSWRRR
ncbi:MAG: spermidine synthase [Dermatophilaceae bacterium]